MSAAAKGAVGPSWARLRRLGRRSPSATFGGVVVGLIVLVALLALAWTPYGPLVVSTSKELLPPSPSHLLGTDEYGRDVLSRLMSSADLTLISSAGAVLIAGLVGIPAGLLAASRGGRLGELIMRAADLVYSFPALLAAITLVAAFGASTATATIAIGIASIPAFARVTRGAALTVLESEYVLAARAYGRSPLAILRRHVLPNVLPFVIVQSSLLLSITVLAVAALSYLGLGTPPPTATWGGMLQSAQSYLYQDPLLAVWPGVAIAVSVLGFNALGDGLRDLLDPTLRSGE